MVGSILQTMGRCVRSWAGRVAGSRAALTSLGCVLLAVSVNGAQPVSRARQQQKVKAWIDMKGLCILPLAGGRVPTTSEQLADALTEGYGKALHLRDLDRVVAVDASRYPTLNSLKIDLTDGAMDPSRKGDKVTPRNKPEGKLGVGRFELVGQPLLCAKSKLNLSLSASDVRLDVDHDRKGKPILLLAEARTGQMSLEITCDDIERLILTSARDAAGPYGVTVVSTRFALDMNGPRSMTARLHLSTKVGFIPAGMTFAAHVDIDDDMNARLSDLRVDGDDVLGPLIVNFLRPGLASYEGKTRPIVSFPSNDMKLRDVKLKVDDAVHLTATFGNV